MIDHKNAAAQAPCYSEVKPSQDQPKMGSATSALATPANNAGEDQGRDEDAPRVPTQPVAAAPTPRTNHYRTEFKRRKETSDLIEWLLDEFAQTETELTALNDKYLTVKLAWKLRSDELTRVEKELVAAKAEAARNEELYRSALVTTKDMIRPFYERAEKAEAALAAAQSKLAEFEQDALNYLWIINDNCGENTADDAVSAVELLSNTDMTSEQLHAAIARARKGE